MSGLQTIMALNKDLNIKKMKKIYFIKAILKLECLVYKNIYIFYFILFTCRAISTLTNPKRGLVKKTTYQITIDV